MQIEADSLEIRQRDGKRIGKKKKNRQAETYTDGRVRIEKDEMPLKR
jgi:hypothetical protein